MDREALRTEGLNAAQLKGLACVCMFIDHLAHVWNPFAARVAQTMPPSLWGYTMYFLGRLAFPIFVFFVAEGCRKTRDRTRYLLRLGVFALLSAFPHHLLFQGRSRNVLLTFFLGALGVVCYDLLRPRVPALLAALPAVGFTLLASRKAAEYGEIGVLLILFLYLYGEDRTRQFLCLVLGLAVQYLIVSPCGDLLTYWIPYGQPFFQGLSQVLVPYLQRYLPFHLLSFLFACAALLPLRFYNGARGGGSKWFFYWFYPLHLLVLMIPLLISTLFPLSKSF